MKRNVRNIFCSILVVALATALPIKAEDNVSGDIGYVHSEVKDNSYVEANVFYKLPGKIKGYTFADFYNGEGGFVGKTSLNKPLWKGVGPRAQIVHGNRLFTRAGLGIEAKIQKMPKNTYMKMRFMPLWIDENGKLAENRVVAGYSCGADLTRGFSLNSYGEMNLGAKNGSTWSYGEIELAKKFGDMRLGYSVALNNKGEGKATPDLEHRIALRFNF